MFGNRERALRMVQQFSDALLDFQLVSSSSNEKPSRKLTMEDDDWFNKVDGPVTSKMIQERLECPHQSVT